METVLYKCTECATARIYAPSAAEAAAIFNSEEADVLRLTTKTTFLLQTVPTTVFKSYATVTECIFATLAAKGQTLHLRVHLALLSMTLVTLSSLSEKIIACKCCATATVPMFALSAAKAQAKNKSMILAASPSTDAGASLWLTPRIIACWFSSERNQQWISERSHKEEPIQ
jgi:hypothetical protein